MRSKYHWKQLDCSVKLSVDTHLGSNSSHDTGVYQGSDQTPQAIYIVPPQPTNEPEHLGYSIFTMLCCFLPLGIAALIFSIKTRDANLAGNGTAARQHSRTAMFLSHLAVGMGLMLLILYIVLTVIMFKARNTELQNP
nr:synapse differentiation-inducing gene protein 1-like isoform X2 [Zootoca vivipara]